MPVVNNGRNVSATATAIEGALPATTDRTAFLESAVPKPTTVVHDISIDACSRRVAVADREDRQLALIRTSPVLRDWVFGNLVSEKAQFEALPKMELDTVTWFEREGYENELGDLKSYLITYAASPAVIAAIMKLSIRTDRVMKEFEQTDSGSRVSGTVIHYKDLHGRHNQNDPITRKMVGEYQGEILKDLERRGIATVFSEGHIENFDGSDPRKEKKMLAYLSRTTIGGEIPRNIEEIFPGRTIPDEFSERQLKFLCHYGAGVAWALLSPNVSFMATTSEKESTEVVRLLGERRLNRADIVMDRRELSAANRVAMYLNDHPGEVVALHFGALHHFSRTDFPDPKQSPAVVSVSWPGLLRGALWYMPAAATGALLATRKDPKKQVEILKHTEAVALSAFHCISSCEGQKLALERLILPENSPYRRDPERLAQILSKNPETGRAIDREVVAKIEYMRSAGLGVFAPDSPRFARARAAAGNGD